MIMCKNIQCRWWCEQNECTNPTIGDEVKEEVSEIKEYPYSIANFREEICNGVYIDNEEPRELEENTLIG